jgi:hypothetical protein
VPAPALAASNPGAPAYFIVTTTAGRPGSLAWGFVNPLWAGNVTFARSDANQQGLNRQPSTLNLQAIQQW